MQRALWPICLISYCIACCTLRAWCRLSLQIVIAQDCLSFNVLQPCMIKHRKHSLLCHDEQHFDNCKYLIIKSGLFEKRSVLQKKQSYYVHRQISAWIRIYIAPKYQSDISMFKMVRWPNALEPIQVPELHLHSLKWKLSIKSLFFVIVKKRMISSSHFRIKIIISSCLNGLSLIYKTEAVPNFSVKLIGDN